jgi:2-(1,2-epoxy-1,2-dihydrophenyl)acetyl-CoA isomerase
MTILVESFAGYRRITLNRPERLNALTVEMAAALNTAIDEAEADRSCRALLLTGAGRGFCAGRDHNRDRRCRAGRVSRYEHYVR